MSTAARRRILVMRYRFIGDTLLTVPFLRNLRKAYPDAQIDLLVAPNSGEVLRDCPYIDELIVFDTTRKHRYETGVNERKSFWSYVKLLQNKKYDTAFVLKRSFSSAALALLAGIPERIGFDTEARGFLLTKKVPYKKERHEVDCFLDVLKAANVPVHDRHLESWWRPAEAEMAASRLPDQAKKNIVLHLTSSNVAKQWPIASAQVLAEWLLTHSGWHVHGLGAASDSPIYEDLKTRLPQALRERFHIHCGQFDLLTSMAFLDRMDLVVGVDWAQRRRSWRLHSGTLHMASAVKTPVVALFGPMDERKWGPMDATILTEPVACRPCNLDTPCRFDFQCMTQLRPERVMTVLQEKLEAHAGLV